jgi:hypothetical protein
MVDDLNKQPDNPKPVNGEMHTEPIKAEPVKAEPVKAEPVKAEPIKTEANKAEPIKTEPIKTDSPSDAARRETSLLDEKKLRLPMPEERTSRPQTGRLTAPWRLLLQIGGQNQTTVGIEVKDRIVLGRSDPVGNFYPDLDLSPYGGQEGGVSRRHAVIVQDDDNQAIYLEDLNSTNGTRINGFSLEPHRRYRLRDGDELEFGRVRVTLRFVRSPYQ